MNYIKDFDIKTVPHHAIVVAVTSDQDYSMDRTLICEDWPEYGDITVINGSHCSCYGFDDTKWEALTYNAKEFAEVVKGWKPAYEFDAPSEALAYPIAMRYWNIKP